MDRVWEGSLDCGVYIVEMRKWNRERFGLCMWFWIARSSGKSRDKVDEEADRDRLGVFSRDRREFWCQVELQTVESHISGLSNCTEQVSWKKKLFSAFGRNQGILAEIRVAVYPTSENLRVWYPDPFGFRQEDAGKGQRKWSQWVGNWCRKIK
jgi:hypothetical protein